MKFLNIKETQDTLEDHRENGIPDGISTGWDHMDKYYSILRGQLNVVSGFPSMGKSEWVENMAVNLVKNEKWTVLMYSPESHPASKHTRSLVEKMVGKQMMKNYDGPVMTQDELSGAIFDVDKYFKVISADDDAYSFEQILSMAEKIKKSGNPLDLLVIDPWNELESHRPRHVSETDYIGICLRDGRRMARKYDINIFIVAHPTKPPQKNRQGKYDPPDLFDISGSQHWRNKCDNGFIVHRHDLLGTRATVYVEKIKNRHYGEFGAPEFEFLPATGQFVDPDSREEDFIDKF